MSTATKDAPTTAVQAVTKQSTGETMSTELQVVPKNQDLARYMPVMSMDEAVQRREIIVQATAKLMKDGVDYGIIPGTKKPTLLQPGADKLCNLFGLTPTFERIASVTDWTGEDHGGEPFICYEVKCKLFRGDYLIAEGEGSCNSWEVKYRYRWLNETEAQDTGNDLAKRRKRSSAISEFEFALQKRDTGGKYGKPAEYWQRFDDAIAKGTARKIEKAIKSGEKRPAWEIASTAYQVPNPEICDQANTVLKIANKRAKVAATINATSASEFFTQDVEDMPAGDSAIIDGQWEHVPEPKQREEAPRSSQGKTQSGGTQQGGLIPPQFYDNNVPDEASGWVSQAEPSKTTVRETNRPAAAKPERTDLEKIEKFRPELGSSEYHAILRNYGYDLPDDIKTLGDARKIYGAMLNRLNKLKIERQEQAAGVSDADESNFGWVPETLSGK